MLNIYMHESSRRNLTDWCDLFFAYWPMPLFVMVKMLWALLKFWPKYAFFGLLSCRRSKARYTAPL